MLTNYEWFQGAVSSLSNESQRIQLLSDLKIAVGVLNTNQVQAVSRSLPLTNIFDCLNSSEKEQVELTSDVLSLLLSPLELSIVLGQYGPPLTRALGHPMPKVKVMVIKEFLQVTSDDETILQLCREQDLLLGIVECIRHEDMAVANAAVSLLVKIGKSPTGQHVIYSNPVLQNLKDAMAQDGLVRFRVYEIGLELSIHSMAGLSASQTSGLLTALINELSSGDILLQLNTIDLLTKLALSPHGLQYLEGQGILQALADKMSAIETDPLASLLLPGLIKFFGNVGQVRPQEMLSRYPAIVSSFFGTLDNPDRILSSIAMETIGYIGTTVQGKYMLQSLGNAMPVLMKKLGVHIATQPTEWRIRALNTVANLIQLKVADQNAEALLVTKSWFDQLSDNPSDLVMSICKLPFPELRLAGLQVLQSVAEQPWGQERINGTPGIVEFLTNRSLESNKLCKDAKFEIVHTIVRSPVADSVISSDTLKHLKEFVREGPYFVSTQTEVAIENVSA